jgi:cytidylate kinase
LSSRGSEEAAREEDASLSLGGPSQRTNSSVVDRAAECTVKTVAIDGPAGAGKSTLARAVAERLGLPRLDTGAMYRAVAYAALMRGVDPTDRLQVAQIARAIELDVSEEVMVDGVDATYAIRTPEVDAAVSAVAANPEVRTEMVARQRAWVAEHGRGVVEGRDIGTVVLPDADLKVYLTASSEERALRRAQERSGEDLSRIAAAIRRRDHLDSTREASPLPALQDVAQDAVVIDSTGRDAREVLEEVLSCL